ncbi:3-methyl-2-oxobutanoate hydroxymethyltransferase, partial [Mesorhizobium sp. A623]
MSAAADTKAITPPDIRLRKNQTPLVCLTAYTTPIAKLVDRHCDIALVGDSVGMVLHGLPSTLGVTLDMMIMHGQAVRRGLERALMVVDMPFGSYEEGEKQAFRNAGRLMAETGCAAVKLEGGESMADTIRFLAARGIPVMAHIGLTPQAVNSFGGYRVQGRGDEADRIRRDAAVVAEAGAFSVVLEKVPEQLARRITAEIAIPTIGIGASPACEALAVVDRNSVAGIVRAHQAAKETGVRLIVGCRLDLADGLSLLVYPTDRPAYARLCRLLSLGKGRGGKGKCTLGWDDVVAYGKGLIVVLVPDEADDTCGLRLRRLRESFGDRGYLALTLRRRPNDQLRLHELSSLAASMHVATVITNDVLFHAPSRRLMQDVVTCIRHNCTIDDAGFRRERHADRYLKPGEEMARLFGRYPEALSRTVEIAERCRFSLDELAYQYPEEKTMPGLTTQQALEHLTWEGAAERYPEGLPDKVRASLMHELRLIEKLEYAPYFLTVNSIVRFARSQGILCQGRGSAANSAVCFVLGVTSIDPDLNDLLFERFVSEERREPPDIDVDFEHERREIVMQWVFETYGRNHAALCSTVIRYRSKGALRDVGKALGLTEDLIKMLSGQISFWSKDGVDPKHAEELNLNLADRRLRLTLELARELIGTPRHLSQHPGGFVLTNDRLDDLVPIEPAAMKDRQVIEWDKDDIDILKFMKVDCLALGMLSCMKRGFDLLSEHKGINLDLASIPPEDAKTYAMIRKADTLGTFQI